MKNIFKNSEEKIKDEKDKKDKKLDSINETMKEDMQDRKDNDIQENISDGMSNNMQGNIPNSMTSNMQGNMPNSMTSNMQGNISNGMQNNMQGNIQNGMTNNMQGNMPNSMLNGMSNNMQGNMPNGMLNNMQDNMLNNMRTNMQNFMQNNNIQSNNAIQSNNISANGMQLSNSMQSDNMQQNNMEQDNSEQYSYMNFNNSRGYRDLGTQPSILGGPEYMNINNIYVNQEAYADASFSEAYEQNQYPILTVQYYDNERYVCGNYVYGQTKHTDESPLIQFRDVVKEYTTGEVVLRALDNVNLDIYEGEIILFLGTSGAGKSTALNLLGGLDKATSGNIIINGEDITDYSEEEMLRFRRDEIGFVFQFYNLVQTMNALDNVAIVTELAGGQKGYSPEELLRMVGLEDKMKNFPSQLSGGEQQRVAIARALAKKPRILLADEPTGALDHENTRQIFELLVRICKDENITLIIVTHNNFVLPIADAVYSFRSGNIVSEIRNENPTRVDMLGW